ncbi:hypothetical protein L1887_29972 [Cichorium endivia]|nr:hypothetical protein L1887_29972 [Cichorium endivia]
MKRSSVASVIKSMDVELKVAWNLYSDSSDRCKDVEAQKRAKSEIQRGITAKKKEKETERDKLDLDIFDDNVRLIDQKEQNLSIEVEGLSKHLTEG